MKKTRKISGKVYGEFMRFKRKISAKSTARRLKSRGGKVRIIKKKGHLPYVLYTRRY